MAKPFDATIRDILEAHPRDSLALLGLHGEPLEVVDADLSTVTSQADRVIRVGGKSPWLVHMEFQASYDRRIGQRLLQYNVLRSTRHEVPVQSAVVLLRPAADGPKVAGLVERRIPGGTKYLEFHYKVRCASGRNRLAKCSRVGSARCRWPR